MKKIIGIVAILVLALAAVASAEPVTLKFSVVEPPQSFAVQKIWTPWLEKMNKEGEGYFKIEIFPGTLHRDPKQNLKVVLDGIADISFTINSYHGGIFADDAVFEVPFVANNAMEASHAAWSMLNQGMLKGYDVIVPLMLTVGRPYTVHSTMEVKAPSDLKGKKMRASGKMQQIMAQVFGAAPVGIPVTGIAEAMSRGIIQATTNEWNAVRTFKINEIAKYHCEVPLGSLSFSLIMNKEKFNSLPKEAQDVFMNNREWTVNLWASQMDESLSAYEKQMESDPDQVMYFPNEAEMAKWKAAAEEATKKWLAEDPEKRQALYDAYKAEVEKYRSK